MRSGMLLLSTGAGIGLATVAIAVGDVGGPRRGASGGTRRHAGGRDDTRGAPAAARVRLREAAGHVHREPRADRRARPLLRAGQPVRVLHDAERSLDVVRQAHAASTAQTRRSGRARAALRRPEPAASSRRASEPLRRCRQRPAWQRSEHSGTRRSRSTAMSSTATCGRGIDLRLREQSGVLKYEFHVRPGASPSDIRLAYGGADGLALDADGRAADLDRTRRAAGLGAGVVPGHRRRPRARAEPLRARRTRHARPLLVRRRSATSATTSWSSTRACSSRRSSAATAPRTAPASRSTRPATPIVAGTTQSPDFPTTAGAFRRTGAASNFADVFVTKLNAGRHGARLLDLRRRQRHGLRQRHGRRRGRQRLRHGHDEVDELPDDRRRVRPHASTSRRTARAAASTTPTASSFKLNAAGSALAYSTYLGGTDIDCPRGIAVDGSGNAYVVGETHVDRLPDDGRCVPAGRVRGQVRHVRHEAEPGRLGAGVLDVPRRHARSTTASSRGRQRRQRLRARRLELDRLPDHRRRVRHDRQRRLRCHPDEAEPGRVGARLLDVHRRPRLRRRPAASWSTAPGART